VVGGMALYARPRGVFWRGTGTSSRRAIREAAPAAKRLTVEPPRA